MVHELGRWNSPVLDSTLPVVATSRWVRTDRTAIERVAGWMAYEEFGLPDGSFLFDFGRDRDTLTDLVLFESTLNFAFTDFETSVRFEVDYEGARYVDAEAMLACIHRARRGAEPLLTGPWMATVTRSDLEHVFVGTIEMPLLDERVRILNEVGATLVQRFDGAFHAWAATCNRAAYAGGNGLLERLIADFPRFDDTSLHHGNRVRFHKLAQLAVWFLHAVWVRLDGEGEGISDLSRLTAFADYIVPLALRLLGILEYDPNLAARIERGELIPRDSEEEVEIRAHTVYATALLTGALNQIRPPELALVIPQVDFRLWKSYHATFAAHHLTRTTMY